MADQKNGFYSQYKMFRKGPSKSLKCLRYFLRNPDATARQGADACGASYNIAWATITDIKSATITGARDRLVEVAGISRQENGWNPSQQEFDLLDVLTNPKLDAAAVTKVFNANSALVDELLTNDKVLTELSTRRALADIGLPTSAAAAQFTERELINRGSIPRIRSKDYIPDEGRIEIRNGVKHYFYPEDTPTRSHSYIRPLADRLVDKGAADVLEENHDWNDEILDAGTEESVSDGSTASYYELPRGATQLQDVISHKNMNSQIGEIFRACMRYGQSSHSNELRDAKKIMFYIEAELKRLGGWDA